MAAILIPLFLFKLLGLLFELPTRPVRALSQPPGKCHSRAGPAT